MENDICKRLIQHIDNLESEQEGLTAKVDAQAGRIAEKQAALYAALAAAQGEFETPKKNREVEIRPRDKPHYKFRYADMEELIRVTRPALVKHGLAVVQPLHDTGSVVNIQTMVVHKGGGTLSATVNVRRTDGDVKQFGGAITYLRRYSYSAILNLAADDDLDEDGAGDGPPVKAPAPKRQPKPATKQPGANPEGLSSGMASVVRKALAGANKTEADLCAAFKVQTIEQIPASKVNDALDWAKS